MAAEESEKELSPPSSVGDDPCSDNPCTPEDLIILVRAIKFAHPEMSIKNVHKEISDTIPNSDETCAFLKDVKLDEVKRVWKKALKGQPSRSDDPNKATQKSAVPTPADGVLKLFTVGDSSVKTLAENYSQQHAQAIIAAAQSEKKDEESELAKYTHFFLDVPADLSGERPHQALISFTDNKKGKKGKKAGSKKKSTKGIASASNDGRDLFKIQVAQLPPGMEDVLTPMVLYNENRSASTFLHPPSPDQTEEDDGGYFKLKRMITEGGTKGAQGTAGGTKAYFWGKITQTGRGPNVVSIDTSELAPRQEW